MISYVWDKISHCRQQNLLSCQFVFSDEAFAVVYVTQILNKTSGDNKKFLIFMHRAFMYRSPAVFHTSQMNTFTVFRLLWSFLCLIERKSIAKKIFKNRRWGVHFFPAGTHIMERKVDSSDWVVYLFRIPM